MSKTTYNIEPVIKPMNPEALNYLNWFMSDANSLRNFASQIFSSDVDLNNPKITELKNAAELSITEIEDDIVKLKEFLAAYIPPNK